MIERWFVALVLAVATSACITGSYEREDRQSMPTTASVQALVPGTSLQACLDALGAPLVVRARGAEAELIWGWQRSKGWNLTLSVPLSDQGGNGSFSVSQAYRGAQGLTLRFDGEQRLVSSREGRLLDLLEGQAKQAPATEE